MSWRYKSPLSFPARYPRAIREAILSPRTPILLHSGSVMSCEQDLNQFNRYKWCIRQRPDVDRSLSRLIEGHDLRLSTSFSGGLAALYLTAGPTIISALEALNPHLSDIIQSN